MAKILLFDIESTNLKADFGVVLCVGYKWFGEPETKVYVPSIMDYPNWQKDVTNDKKLVTDFNKVYSEADMVVSYFGKGFDVKFLQAKYAKYGIQVPPNTPHVDLFYTVKANLALSRKSLDNVARFLRTPHQKTPVEGDHWMRAMAGHPRSIKYVIDHCRSDVLVLEDVYKQLRPYVRQHPRVAGMKPCRVCGGTRFHLKGHAMTVTQGPKIRLQCQTCGAWENRLESSLEGPKSLIVSA